MASWCPVSLNAIPLFCQLSQMCDTGWCKTSAVKDVMVPIHPLVANPYNVLAQVPENAKWFAVLDLKDTFFYIPVHPPSQYLFAFKWTNSHSGQMKEYIWTILPQGFWDNPHLFNQALGKEQREICLKERAILQYVDDILICSPTMEASDENIIEVLNFLGTQGYRVSQKKAQISKQHVKYLGYIINSGRRQLSQDRKQTILGLSAPKTKKHLRTFLDMAGFCRI